METQKIMQKSKWNLRRLRLSLKYRPEIYRLILKMRLCIKKKNATTRNLKHRLKELENKMSNDSVATPNNTLDTTQKNSDQLFKDIDTKNINGNKTKQEHDTNTVLLPLVVNQSTQTDEYKNKTKEDTKISKEEVQNKKVEAAWNIEDTEQKSIADQVKEAAQDAMKESGMVYVESAGMYYDYKTGYYYNSELGLYYHPDTGCYYYYSDDKKSFVFHSYPDRSADSANAALLAHEKKKAKKHKMEKKKEDDIENLTKNLSQDGEDSTKEVKKRKKSKKRAEKIEPSVNENNGDDKVKIDGEIDSITSKEENEVCEKVEEPPIELEDGECSDSGSEKSDDDEEDKKSSVSTSTASDDESVARHHPPCMRIIVRETELPKLRVGSLFIVTKDGGTIGREGDHHTILLRDTNVSRNHLNIRYDMERRSYMATDLGSKNGTVLNGSRMSESQIQSEPTEIVHGSTLQLGETKLLCHIHPGNDTCGHCEPGLIMTAQDKEKQVAYTRTCSVKKQHQLELARLKNRYAPQPLAIEETAYNDRAHARREAVGSSHHAEKTLSADVDTFIAPENKGFKLLQKMGWSKGEGLGKDNQGDVDPVPLVSNDGTAGLGAMRISTPKPTPLAQATLRLANRTKILKPPAKAFQQGDDEDENE